MCHFSHMHFVCDWVFAHAARAPERPAVATPLVAQDYGTLAARVDAWADAFCEAGIGRRTPVVVALSNSPAAVAASLALQCLGACPVEVSRDWTSAALRSVLQQVGACHAVVAGRDAHVWGELRASERLRALWVVHPSAPDEAMLAALGGSVEHAFEDGRLGGANMERARRGRRVSLAADDVALVLFTSGSTGTPRGVIQTHGNIAANTRSIVESLGLGSGDRAMCILPLYYCYGRSVLQTHLYVGGSVFFDHRFTYPRVVLEAIATEGCTGFAGVPLTFEVLRSQVGPAPLELPLLRYVTQAGGAMQPATARWVRRAFAPAQLFVMYGQTEATARLAYLPPEHAEAKEGAIGVAIPGVTLRVANDRGDELGPDVVGHLLARGDNVTPGYVGAPDETAAVLRDGWLWTGDLARRDRDGFFFIEGRAKEILKLGGHRVSPVEIEHQLQAHPGILEAAVVGAPDELTGEIAVAFVVLHPEHHLSPADVRAHCRERLPRYMVPARVIVVEALPRSSAGKLQKKALCALLLGTNPPA